jgi:hypothetical protein
MGTAYDISRRHLTPRAIALNVGLALGIALAVFTWFQIANVVTQTQPAAVPLSQQPTSIVWRNHVFSSRAALAAWLRANHINVTTWLRQHPDAAKIIDGQSPSPGTTARTASTRSVKKSAAPAGDKPPPAGPSRSRSSSKLAATGVDLLVALAVLLGAFAFAPTSAWRLVLRGVRGSLEERICVGAGAVCILFGVGAGGLFS